MEISLLRLYLLSGLILHKAVWEVLKRREPRKAPAPAVPLKSRVLSMVKIAILAGIVAQTLAPEIAPISSQPQALRLVGFIVYSLGLAMAIVARFQLGRNWSDIEKSRVKGDHILVAHGIYRWIRHPIYAGDLLLLLGLELALNSWGVAGVLLLAVYVRQKAAGEEKDLARTLAGYDQYCRRTSRFLPFLPG
ncbi:MAG TPA: isoprenylcysteine carboxylmethyltransferase family protein [Bryobacteraceae bacterium]|jgi:protein-S-isoprenylcysteine O-methyltransferase Ste14